MRIIQKILKSNVGLLIYCSVSCKFHLAIKVKVISQIISRHFNGHFPSGQGLADTRISPLWIGAKGDGGGNNWSYKTCKAPVKMKGSVKEPNISIYFFFLPITQWCSISDVLFTGGRRVSDFSVLKYY